MPDSLFEFVENLNDQLHTRYICEEVHTDDSCDFCTYGQFVCSKCGADESCLTTHCRGEKLDPVMLEMVAMGQADFIDGFWIVPAAVRSLRFNK